MLDEKCTCPCCGYITLRERANWESCPICSWMDDDLQSYEPDFVGGPNDVSLREAQRNFVKLGKCSKLLLKRESSPISEYLKDQKWKPLE